MENIEEFLDWLVSLDIQHYKTKPDYGLKYTPSGKSHFYLKFSPDRFTSAEMIKIFTNQTDNELNSRWNEAMSKHVQGAKLL